MRPFQTVFSLSLLWVLAFGGAGCGGESTGGDSDADTDSDSDSDSDSDVDTDTDTDTDSDTRPDSESDCGDGIDDDGDGYTDCDDFDCDTDPACGAAEDCANGADDDGDGDTDCADADCATDAACVEDCSNRVDDDGDGDADCLDVDCDGSDGCEHGAEATCDDAFDNDADGDPDCADADCVRDPFCAVEDCANVVDDDFDGDADCADLDCDGVGTCEFGAEATCNDGVDNDGDGDVDCADADCVAGALVCSSPLTCDVGHTAVAYEASDVPVAIPDWGAGGPGVADSSVDVVEGGTVSQAAVQVSITHTWDADLALSLRGPCGGAACRDDLSSGNGGSGDNFAATVFDDAAPDSITTGAAPFAGSYRPEAALANVAGADVTGSWSLHVEDQAGGDTGSITDYVLYLCVCEDCEVGDLCLDGADNDADGTSDCADPECAGDARCTAEAVCADGVDDDLDGLVDCEDPDCEPTCVVTCSPGDEHWVFSAADLPQGIADFVTTTSTINIFMAGYTVRAVAAGVTLTHTWDSDLSLSLISAAGTVLDMSSGNGGSNDNYTNTIFVDTAGTAITAGAAPFSGRYRPEVALGTLAGQDAGNTWQLRVYDGAGGDAGSLTDFDVYFCLTPP